MAILDSVVRRTRNLVATDGLPPEQATRQAIDEQSESSSTPMDEIVFQEHVSRELSGFGFLQPLMDDPAIEEIWVNEPGEIHYFSTQHFVIRQDFSSQQLRNLVFKLLAHSGRKVDRLTPYVDASLKDGSRLHVVIPEVTKDHWSINIRKFRKGRITLDELEDLESLSTAQSIQLKSAMANQKSILIVGATQAGKTTLMSALLAELSPDERLVSCEDTFELNLSHRDWVAMQVRPQSAEGTREISLRELVKQSLRMRPSRLVIGEVRGAEALDMLVALNSGIPGICTIHANSARQGLQKLLTLPLLAGENITESFLRPTILGAFDLVVFCKRSVDGKRRVEELLEVNDAVL